MKRVFLTGMSATGKSTVITELAARGYKAVDTDYDGWSELVDLPANSKHHESGLGGKQDWLWREDRIARLLATEDADVLFVSGGATNQVKFYKQFDHIVLLTAPISVITARLLTRTNNPYGTIGAANAAEAMVAFPGAPVGWSVDQQQRTTHPTVGTSGAPK